MNTVGFDFIHNSRDTLHEKRTKQFNVDINHALITKTDIKKVSMSVLLSNLCTIPCVSLGPN